MQCDSLEIYQSTDVSAVAGITELYTIQNVSLYQASEKGVKRVRLSIKPLVNIESGKYTKIATVNSHVLPNYPIAKPVVFNTNSLGFLTINSANGSVEIFPNVTIPANQLIYIDETYI